MIDVGCTFLRVYEVQKLLGAGGSGKVFLVRRTLDDMLYAVKTINSEKLDSTQLRQDLMREIRVSQKLGDHPHIVPSRFFRIVDDEFAVFSDYVKGGTLQYWIRSGKVSSHQILLDIAIQIAWGLYTIHEAGILHKDIKPANILMEPDGRARIADFGLIRGLTPKYCSPEQAAREKLTPATDIWSWALVVMTMWFGKSVWMLGPQVEDALPALEKTDWPHGKMPESLVNVLMSCTRTNPEERPMSMGYVAEQLKKIFLEITGLEYYRIDPPEYHSTTESHGSGTRRKSVMDGLTWDDPRKLVDEIKKKLRSADIDAGSLIPELEDTEINFVDDLHAYIHIEEMLRKMSSEGSPQWLDMLRKTLTFKSWLLMDSGDLQGAIDVNKETAGIIRELILYHDRKDLWGTMGNRFCDLSLLYMQKRNMDLALKHNKKAVELLEKTPEKYKNSGYLKDLQLTYANRGIIYNTMRKTDLATKAFRKSLDYARQNTDDKGSLAYNRRMATAAYNLGSHLQEWEHCQEALKHLEEAAEFQKKASESKEVHEFVFLAKITSSIAVTFARLQEYNRAEQFFNKSEKIFAKLLNLSTHTYVRVRYTVFLKNKAYFYATMEQYEKALIIQEEALKIAMDILEKDGNIENAYLVAGLHSNRAEFLDAMGRKKEAEKELELAERYNDWYPQES